MPKDFGFLVDDIKVSQNQVANHLFRLEDYAMCELGEKAENDDAFLYEHVLSPSQDLIPWFAGFESNLASTVVPSNLIFNQRKKFMHDVRTLFWYDHYLY